MVYELITGRLSEPIRKLETQYQRLNNTVCYIPRFSLNKTSTVIG